MVLVSEINGCWKAHGTKSDAFLEQVNLWFQFGRFLKIFENNYKIFSGKGRGFIG